MQKTDNTFSERKSKEIIKQKMKKPFLETRSEINVFGKKLQKEE